MTFVFVLAHKLTFFFESEMVVKWTLLVNSYSLIPRYHGNEAPIMFPVPHVLLLAVWKAEGESLCDTVLYRMSQHRAKLSPLAFHTACSGV